VFALRGHPGRTDSYAIQPRRGQTAEPRATGVAHQILFESDRNILRHNRTDRDLCGPLIRRKDHSLSSEADYRTKYLKENARPFPDMKIQLRPSIGLSTLQAL